MKILITGGTGFLGRLLSYALLRKGHEIVILTRQSAESLQPSPFRILNWPLNTASDKELMNSCDTVIHLAGESIGGKRWSKEQKEKIRSSRIQFTDELVDVLRESTQLKIFISSSAIGFYGDRKTEVLNENSPRGEGFLSDVCVDWEAAAKKLTSRQLRTVLLRTGVVLSRGHGFLTEIEPLFRNWVGGPVGDGEQILSWIHVDDWVRAVVFCLENSNVSGPVNLTAPEAVSNKSFSKLMADLFRQPFSLPAPASALKIILGEMSALALHGQNVRPEKLLEFGFKFEHSYMADALSQLYNYEKTNRKSASYFTSTVWVKAPLEKVFEFFSDEKKLGAYDSTTIKFSCS